MFTLDYLNMVAERLGLKLTEEKLKLFIAKVIAKLILKKNIDITIQNKTRRYNLHKDYLRFLHIEEDSRRLQIEF